MSRKRAFLDHAAVAVNDLAWHLDFFTRVLGMTESRRQESPEGKVLQIWLDGGVQLVQAQPDGLTTYGHSRHLGIVLDDFTQTIKDALATPGVKQIPGAPATWLQLPGGLVLELFPAVDGAIEKALQLDINQMQVEMRRQNNGKKIVKDTGKA